MNEQEKKGRDRITQVLVNDAKNKGREPNMNEIEKRVRETQERVDKRKSR